MSRRGGCALLHSEHALILSFCFRCCFLFVCYRSNQSKQYELAMVTKAKRFSFSFGCRFPHRRRGSPNKDGRDVRVKAPAESLRAFSPRKNDGGKRKARAESRSMTLGFHSHPAARSLAKASTPLFAGARYAGILGGRGPAAAMRRS